MRSGNHCAWSKDGEPSMLRKVKENRFGDRPQPCLTPLSPHSLKVKVVTAYPKARGGYLAGKVCTICYLKFYDAILESLRSTCAGQPLGTRRPQS